MGLLQIFKTAAKPRTRLRLFRFVTTKDALLLVASILFLTLAAVLSWVINENIAVFQTRVLADRSNNSGYTSALINSLWKLVVVMISLFIASVTGITTLMLFCDRQIKEYKINCLRVLLNKDMSYFDSNLPGSLVVLLNRIDPVISEKLGYFTYSFFLLCVAQIANFVYSWQMALCANILTIFFIFSTYMFDWITRRAYARYEELTKNIANMVADVMEGISTVINCNGQKFEVDRYNKLVDEQVKERRFIKHAVTFCIALNAVAVDIIYVFCCWIALILSFNSHNKVPFAASVVYVEYILNVLCLAWQLTPYFSLCLSNFRTLKQLIQVLDSPSNELNVGSKRLNKVNGNINFVNVQFKYPSRPDTLVLKGVELEIKAGQKVAFVGSSGSGKSTAAAMLVKLLHPTQGRIYLDDARLDTLNTHHLRTIVGYVPQEPVLFTNTVKENLCMGFEVTEQKLREACRTAYALEFIERLPQGFNTVIGAGGVRLSGGQKQRLAIARALVRDPRILVLDEATSALDTESETVVQSALDAASQGRTTITIAHRLSTIRNADNIFVFEQGIVIENGTHDELVAANGSYAGLVRAQRLGANNVEQRLKLLQSEVKTPQIDYDQEVLIGISSKKPNEESISFIKLVIYSEKYIWLIIVAIISGLIGGATLGPLNLILSEYVKLSALTDTKKALNTARNLFFYAFIDHAVLAALIILTNFLLIFYGLTIATKLRKMAYKKILSQDGYFFDQSKNEVGCLLKMLSEEPQNFDMAYDGSFCILLNYVGGYIGPNIQFAVFYAEFVLISMAVIITTSFIVMVWYFLVQNFNKKENEAEAIAANIASESLYNIKSVKLNNSESYFNSLYKNTLYSVDSLHLRRVILNGFLAGAGLTFVLYSTFVMCLIGVILVIKRRLQPIAIIVTTAAPVRYVFQASLILPDISRSFNAFKELYRVAIPTPKINGGDALRGNRPSRIKGTVVLNNVNFAYPTRPEHLVLRDLTLSLPRGKTVALVGASGCGKSTIVQLLSRMYDPVNGQLKLDGIPYTTWNTQRLRSAFAFVGQTPALFDLPIWQNIAYGHPSATWEEIQDAARAANIHDFIRGLPSGYETCLGSRGTQLSGGQRQRLAIARALVRNPSVIVLDEATSALDARSEAAFQTTLATATKGKTCLIIAHRLSTVRDADVIIVLQNGQVTEQGTHHQLINKGGIYSRLVAGQ